MLDQEKIWNIQGADQETIDELVDNLNISPIMAHILANRGLKTPQEVEEFLDFSLEDLNDPFLLKDMEEASSRIEQAINNQEKIVIYGDYDADGITSTSLLITVLENLNANIDYYIPNRLKEGYGLNKDAISNLAQQDTDLIVTVDCGISGIEEVNLANELGIDVIITDHHTVPDNLPQALAILNPKQKDCSYPFKKLAGVGVAFKLVHALLLKLGKLDSLDQLIKYMSIVTVGTVADIVPLVGENRIIVKYGLKRINSFLGSGDFNIGILKGKVGYKSKDITAGAIGYYLAPCINATGRLGQAHLGVQMLTEEDIVTANNLADQLREMNVGRQDITSQILAQAEKYIAQNIDLEEEKVLVITLEEGHPGVIGNAASKLQERYYRPIVLLTYAEDGRILGSARSIRNFNLYEAFKYCEECFEGFGGHKEAAGCSLKAENINKFRKMINGYADQVLAEEDLIDRIKLEQVIDIEDASKDLVRELSKLEPYGCGNPRPKFALKDLAINNFSLFGKEEDHIKIYFDSGGRTVESIAWNMAEIRKKLLVQNEDIDLAFTMDINDFGGTETVSLTIKDIKFPELSFVDQLFAKSKEILEDDFYRGIAENDSFYTKVVGVTFEGRQDIIKDHVNKGDVVFLVRDPDNQYDKNAIQVVSKNQKQIGFLKADLSKHLAPYLDNGIEYKAIVSEVTGGIDNKQILGVNLFIEKAKITSDQKEDYETKLIRSKLATKTDNQVLDEIRNSLIGDYSFRPKQAEAIDSLFKEQNTLAIFGTGRGKSAVFQSFATFQAIKYNQMTIIIYPLRALVNDQFHSLKEKLSPLGIRVYKGNGALTVKEREELNQALNSAAVDVLLTTPEFIEYNLDRFSKIKDKIGFFVVDESHHIGLASNQFRPTYKRIPQILSELGEPLVLAVTATANDQVTQEIVDCLSIENLVIDTHIRENLNLIDKRNSSNKENYIDQVVKKGEKTIVYVNSREKSIEIASALRDRNPFLAQEIVFYNAGLTNQERSLVEDKFRNGEIKVVVSTSAFGEGIDIPDIKHIILYHLNFNRTEFNQQSGRAGRDGRESYIHLLYGEQDARINEFILEIMAPDRDVLAQLYIILTKLKDNNREVIMTNQELADQVGNKVGKKVQASTISAGLGILEELKLLTRLKESSRIIKLSPKPDVKLDLTTSIRYNEGVEDKQAFVEFKKFALEENSQKLLNLINQPIYPKRFIELKGENKVEFIR
ncbi:single-stranded-DNA-specific exonuclease RecJ [Orenia marismortui]|uniref:Single-stranded-DNA-specific exonuclease RecJ n=1 Tax=Orenia marismortui TaxID=46469 RepID=A0A4R8GWE8_9FIRM|nr:single-stranded-DNA-specific exonuclease RecJ [Orenia marismortui]TDX48004.1 single-stranded-DNA-specific exonuclease [Orenia marismortui]